MRARPPHPTCPDLACEHAGAAPSELGRRMLLGGGLAAGATLALGGLAKPAAAFLPPAPKNEVHIRPIVFPVVGKVSWTDTYLAPRGSRRHEGCDLMGTRMQKLVAAVTGTIVELRHRSTGGGNAIYLRGDDGWYYCYLHINNDRPGTDDGSNIHGNAFAPGIKAGVRVRQGQHIAYMGDSGNAEASGVHLHFEIRKPNARWYDAAAVNPTYSLQRAKPAVTQVPLSTFRPFPDSASFMRQATLDTLGRPVSDKGLVEWAVKLNHGEETPESVLRWLIVRHECWNIYGPLSRIHLGVFDRWPDATFLGFVDAYRARRVSLTDVAAWWLNSADAQRRFAGTDDQFISTVYTRMRGRAPSATEHQQSVTALSRGGRAALVAQNAESNEAKYIFHQKTKVIATIMTMLRRGPSHSSANWLPILERSDGWDEMLRTIRLSAAYANRF